MPTLVFGMSIVTVGLVVLTTVAAVVFNLLVDLAYAWLDPRIRY